MEQPSSTTSPSVKAPSGNGNDANNGKKPPNRAKLVLVGLVLLAVSVSSGWYVMGLGKESTDNAQVEGHIVTVPARISGQVQKVLVKDPKNFLVRRNIEEASNRLKEKPEATLAPLNGGKP